MATPAGSGGALGTNAQNFIMEQPMNVEECGDGPNEGESGSEEEAPENARDEGLQRLKPKPGKKTRGRVKIKFEYITKKDRRFTTFSKRKTGLMKKAYELSALTGTQVMLLVASETGHVYTFATRKLMPIVTSEQGKALIQTCLSTPEDSNPTTDNSMFERAAAAAAACDAGRSDAKKQKIGSGSFSADPIRFANVGAPEERGNLGARSAAGGSNQQLPVSSRSLTSLSPNLAANLVLPPNQPPLDNAISRPIMTVNTSLASFCVAPAQPIASLCPPSAQPRLDLLAAQPGPVYLMPFNGGGDGLREGVKSSCDAPVVSTNGAPPIIGLPHQLLCRLPDNRIVSIDLQASGLSQLSRILVAQQSASPQQTDVLSNGDSRPVVKTENSASSIVTSDASQLRFYVA